MSWLYALLLLGCWVAFQPALGQPFLRDGDTVSADKRDRELIVEGTIAPPGQFPWFASFLPNSPDPDEKEIGCGGTLISPTRVLTAAHCVNTENPPAYVRVGHLTKVDGEVLEVDCVSVHPDYGGFSRFACIFNHKCELYNDISIVKLSEKARTVTLNNRTAYPFIAGQELTTIGFGYRNVKQAVLEQVHYRLGTQFSPKPFDLHKVTTKYLTEAECKERWTCSNSTFHIFTSVEGDGICVGDSGGPLLDNDNVQIGVTSFNAWPNSGCASTFPDVFVNVAQYSEWIQNETISNTCTEPVEFGPIELESPLCSDPGCFGGFNKALERVEGFFAGYFG